MDTNAPCCRYAQHSGRPCLPPTGCGLHNKTKLRPYFYFFLYFTHRYEAASMSSASFTRSSLGSSAANWGWVAQ